MCLDFHHYCPELLQSINVLVHNDSSLLTRADPSSSYPNITRGPERLETIKPGQGTKNLRSVPDTAIFRTEATAVCAEQYARAQDTTAVSMDCSRQC